MRKITLDVAALQVESFETVDETSKERGTVHGYHTHQVTCPQTMCGQQCLSGWHPCQPTDAFTDGVDMCYCGNNSLDCP